MASASVLLRDAQRSVASLEQRRETLVREHQYAIEQRRALLLNNTDDAKALSKADTRVSAAESSLVGVEDALGIARARSAELQAAFDAERAKAASQAETVRIEQIAKAIEDAYAKFLAPAEALFVALDAGRDASPHVAGAAAMIGNVNQ